ncbi:MAG: FliH/SctL family protein [Clostridia bacterium]|nr:FliH/SctL family protein [Clostridia bacterium]MDD4665246.1 FliH/SctL family protein [Clostridia bacterium]
MSKVIKACFVKDGEKKDFESKNAFAVISHRGSQGEFTKETAYTIYQETKMMIEELISEAEKKAKMIISEAEKKAKTIINKNQIEYEEVKKIAYEEGIKSGYQEGMGKAEKEIKNLAQETKVLAQNLGTFKGKYLRDNEEEIIDLILLISQKIINTVIELKPEIICSIVKNVLAEVGDAEKLMIKVNPVHLPYLDVYNEQFKEINMSKLRFEGDLEVEPGECILVTENGFIDVKIDEQLLLLKKALKEENNYVGL